MMFRKRMTADATAFGTGFPASPQRGDAGGAPRQRAGYSLVEVLIAVSLTLILMYAIASIFSQVGSVMTQTQHVLEMTNNLRTTKDRLVSDLENLTVPKIKAPSSKYGFFSYVEGVGPNLTNQVGPLAGNFDRNKTVGEPDATVGDTDDILSFTVRAPAGKWFRGRCFKEHYDANAAIDDNIEMIESEYAEVIWFLRGTTLYRRVLLIIPDDVLEARMTKLNQYLADINPALATPQTLPTVTASPEAKFILPENGFGFFRYFDVSVHFDGNKPWAWNGVFQTGRIVANTLSDLANRSCRFGYWEAAKDDLLVAVNPATMVTMNANLYGKNLAWYWLRMPTLQESATVPSYFVTEANRYFCAGSPFGTQRNISLTEDGEININQSGWPGRFLRLIYSGLNPVYSGRMANTMTDSAYVTDLWRNPNPWAQQDAYSGQLFAALYPDRSGDSVADRGSAAKSLTQDVILTNVLSFDVKVWNQNDDVGSDQSSPGFVDLGSYFLHNNVVSNESTDFRASGNYGGNYDAVNNRSFNAVPLYRQNDPTSTNPFAYLIHPSMPAVFDTWTEEYEKDFLSETHYYMDAEGNNSTFTGASSRPGFTVGDIPLDGEVTAADLPDFPPPYEAEIKAIQIELRVFDPVSRTIKNSTVEVRFDR